MSETEENTTPAIVDVADAPNDVDAADLPPPEPFEASNKISPRHQMLYLYKLVLLLNISMIQPQQFHLQISLQLRRQHHHQNQYLQEKQRLQKLLLNQ